MTDIHYKIECAKTGRSKCKNSKCKQEIEKDQLRIGKIFPSDRFTDGGTATDWFHHNCFFESQKRARKTSRKVDDSDDLDGFESLDQKDQKTILKLLQDQKDFMSTKKPSKPKKSTTTGTSAASSKKPAASSTWTIRDSNDNDEDDNSKPSTPSKKTDNEKKVNSNGNKKVDDDNYDSIFEKFEYKKNGNNNNKPTTTTTTSTTTTRKKVTLKSILSEKWFESLESIITKNTKYDEYLNGSKVLPKRSEDTFLALNAIPDPKDCRVVIFGQAPYRQRESSSGYSYCDESSKHWQLKDCKVPMKNLLKQAMMWKGFASKDDDLSTLQDILSEIDLPSDSPKDWFKSTSKQGVLWLNTSLTCQEGEEDIKNHQDFWRPVIEEIIRTIFHCKLESSNISSLNVDGNHHQINGIVFLLFGKHFSYLKQVIEVISSEFLGAVPMEILNCQPPILELFNSFDCFKQINLSLKKTNQAEIDWWKPKEDDDQDHESDSEHEKDSEMFNESNIDFTGGYDDDDNNNNNKTSSPTTTTTTTQTKPTPTSTPVKSNSEDFECYIVREDGLKFQIEYGIEITIGRKNLDINDLSISRRHASLFFKKNQKGQYVLELTPTGSHPMNLTNGDGDLTLLPSQQVSELYHGQQFLLCNNKYPFVVEISNPNKPQSQSQSQSQSQTTTPQKQQSSLQKKPSQSSLSSQQSSISSNKITGNKRKFEENDDEEFAKNLQKQFNQELKASTTPPKSSKTNKPTTATKTKPKSEKKRRTGPKDMDLDSYDYDDDFIADDSDDDYHSGASSESDDNGGYINIPTRSDNRPMCRYGENCYRKNVDHFKEYRHPK